MVAVCRRLVASLLAGLLVLPTPVPAVHADGRPGGRVDLSADLDNATTGSSFSPTDVLDVAAGSARSDRARAIRAHRHLMEAREEVALRRADASVAATQSVAASPQVVSPPVAAITGVVDWRNKVRTAGSWYAVAVKRATGWTIMRSTDGLNWSEIGLPAGWPTSTPPTMWTINELGYVFIATANYPNPGPTVSVSRYGPSGWSTVGNGGCYTVVGNAGTENWVLASMSSVAIILGPQRCMVSSTDNGVTWRSSLLTGGTQFFLSGTILHAIACSNVSGSTSSATAYGRINLLTQSAMPQATVPIVGCRNPTLLTLAPFKVAFVSRATTSDAGDFGRSNIIAYSEDSGQTWTNLTYGEPLPTRFNKGVDTSTRMAHTDQLFYGTANGKVLLRGFGTVNGSFVFTRGSRDVGMPTEQNGYQWAQDPTDPGRWLGAITRYTYGLSAASYALTVPLAAGDSDAIDGLVLSGTTLYALTGTPEVVESPPITQASRTGIEVALASGTLDASATSHSGYFSAFSTSGNLYRVRPDGTVDVLGAAPAGLKGIQLVVTDGGAIMALGYRWTDPTDLFVTERLATAYWVTDQWYGPYPILQEGYGPVTSTEEMAPGLPSIHMTGGSKGFTVVSSNFGMTWTKLPNTTPGFTGTPPAVYSNPYQYIALPTSVVRRQIATGAVNQYPLPAGTTSLGIQIGPASAPGVYVVGATGSTVSLLRLDGTTWSTVASGILPPASGATYAFGADGRLNAYKSSVCSAGTFINRWALVGSTFVEPNTLWWGPAPGSGGAGTIAVPSRPNGAVDEWQTMMAPAGVTIVAPASLTSTQSGFGAGGYGAAADGVNLSLGNFTTQATDLSITTAGEPMNLVRTFNGLNPRTGIFGQGWSTTYEMKLAVNCGTGAATVVYPDGRMETHSPNGAGGFTAPPGFTTSLSLVSGVYRLATRNGTVYEFNSSNGRLTKITDALGRSQVLAYDSGGRLTSITDQLTSRALTLVYSGALVTEVRSTPVTSSGVSAPLTVRYGYVGSTLERVCAATDPDLLTGDCTLFTMTGGRLTAVVDPNGHTDVGVGYDGAGRVIWQDDGEGSRTSIEYVTPLKTVQTDATGRSTTIESDSQFRQTRVTDSAGHPTTYTYDAKGFPATTQFASGAVKSATYDAVGNILTSTNSAGEVKRFTYDSNDNPVAIADERAAGAGDTTYSTMMTWDGPRHLMLTTSLPPTSEVPSSTTTTTTYTTGSEPAVGGGVMPAWLVRSERTATGETTWYSYDAKGNLRTVVAPSGLTTKYTVDELGRVLTATEISDSFPNGVTRAFEYDAASRITKEYAPAVVNAVTGVVHQQLTEQTFDHAGNLTMVTTSDVGGSGQPDATRQVLYTFDSADRPLSQTTIGGGSVHNEYDAAGRIVATIDPLGHRTVTEYDSVGRASRQYVQADALAGPTADQTVWSKTYDVDGRVATETDARGQVTEYHYDAAGRVTSATLRDYHEPTGAARNVVLNSYVYDATGRIVQQTTRGSKVETYSYDAAGRLRSQTIDPTGVNRTTSYTYDSAGRALSASITDGTRTESARYTYDSAGRLAATTRENGAVDVTTTYLYDQRGLQTGIVDPRGNAPGASQADFTTNVAYDELGRPVTTAQPGTQLYANGVTATVMRPTVTTGYDTFGDGTQVADPRGNVTGRVFDQTGRTVEVHLPAYTTPGGVTLRPVEHTTYDAAGNVSAFEDRRGFITTYGYDFRNRLTTVTAPSSTAGTPVTSYEYDQTGNLTARTDPTGARVEATYDDLGRVATSTQVVRQSSGPSLALTTSYTYDDLDNLLNVTSPEGRTQTGSYDAVSERIGFDDGAGNHTSYTYDLAGRLVQQIDPLSRSLTTTYDLLGNPVESSVLSAGNAVIATTQRTFDAAGNLTSITTPNGVATPMLDDDYRTSFAYNANNSLTGVSQATDATTQMATSYRFDAAGNMTATVNGRGALTRYEYNEWNLPTTIVEPSTPTNPTTSARTWTTTYDAGGLPVQLEEPGGFTTTRHYNAYGQATLDSATDGVTLVTRQRDFDLASRVTQVNAPDGEIGFQYDDRGLLVATTGTARVSSGFVYDGDGLPTARTDSTGTATFQWDDRAKLSSVTDPVSEQTLTYTFDAAGQPSEITTSGGVSYAYAFDGAGRLTSETAKNSASGTLAARSYEYDLDGNLTSQTIEASGNAQAGTHTYTYDWADRLVGWDSPIAPLVEYGWDSAGNRTSVGGTTFTFDDRNRLIGSSDGLSNTYDARGDLLTSVSSNGVTSYDFDPFGRLVSIGGRTATYDDLDRLVTLGTDSFSYAGVASDPNAAGDWKFGRSPAGSLISTRGATAADLVIADRHGDVSLAIDPVSQVVAGTQVFDPFGSPAATTGQLSPVGFQGDVTDAGTGDVWMGARWMSPTTGVFMSRDTYSGAPANPVTLNRYSYANNNPLAMWDPTGHKAEAIDAAPDEGHRAAVEQTHEIAVRRSNGDVSVAAGVPLLNGPSELIAAFKVPKATAWSYVKTLVVIGVSVAAGAGCGMILAPLAAICAGVAGRVAQGVLSGASAKEIWRSATDLKSILRDGVIGLVTMGVGAAFGSFAAGEVSFLGQVAVHTVGAIVAGGVSDFLTVVMEGGSASDGLDAAFDLQRRTLDAGIGLAVGLTEARRSRNSTEPVRPAAEDPNEAPLGEPRSARVTLDEDCNSFEPDTAVLMADGTTKPIDEVKVGDSVIATDPVTGKTGPHLVVALIRHATLHTIVDLSVAGDAGVETIAATDHHPFYVNSHGGRWVDAGVLNVGDQLRSPDGSTRRVVATSTRIEHETVYNLTIEGVHTYYVGKDQPVLVHNSSCPLSRNNPPKETATEEGPSFFRGAKPGEAPSFEPRPNDFKVDPATGTVKPTHGVSVFDNPGSVTSKGFVPHEVDVSSVPPDLQIIQRGADPTHFEITPQVGANLTPEQYKGLMCQIVCKS